MLNEKLNENLYKKMDLNIMYFGSGTLSGTSTSSGGECRMLWSSSVISGTNKSNVTITFQARRTTAGSTYCTLAGTLKIDGTAKSVSKYRPSSDPWNNTWKEVGSQTKEVTHSADGSKSIKVEANVNGDTGSMEGNFKASSTITLDKINRASVLGLIDNFSINDTISIPITKYVETFTDNLVIKSGTTTIKTINGITNGYSLTFTTAEKTAIKNLMTSPQIALVFTLTTMNGATVVGTGVQGAVVSSLDMPIAFNLTKKANGHYQWAFNGLVNPDGGPLQAYDDDGNESFFYKPGDTYEAPVSGNINMATAISSGSTRLYPSINVPKSLKYINTIVCNKFSVTSRGVSGYLNSVSGEVDYANSSGYTVTCYKVDDYTISMVILKSSAFTNVTNNTPVSLIAAANGLKFTFSWQDE